MFVGKKLYVVFTKEEKETLTKAKEILMNFESLSSTEEEEELQDLYAEYVDFCEHAYALPTAVDLLSAILEKGETDDEI